MMPMKALCGAASQCRGATTVRQLQTRGELWEAAGCVEHTERVQLHWHAKIVAIQTEACVCSWGGASACCSEPCGDLLTELLSPGGRKRLTLRMPDKVSETAAGLSA